MTVRRTGSPTRRVRGVAVFLGAALLLGVPTANASPLEDAKAAGQIGERPDGRVGLVRADLPAEVQSLVREVNARREERYAEIARENGVAMDAVAARAGAKLIERTPPGQYVLIQGRWVQKK